MDQRTCRSYSLPCFSFPALVDWVNSDVVSGFGLQALHGSGYSWDLQGHFFPSSTGNVFQPVVAHLAWCWRPCGFHGMLSLI